MGCHSVGEGSNAVSGGSPPLSRVGEKDNYDYLVRWIHDPRERTSPYCPYEKRDLTADDYKNMACPLSSTSPTRSARTTVTSCWSSR